MNTFGLISLSRIVARSAVQPLKAVSQKKTVVVPSMSIIVRSRECPSFPLHSRSLSLSKDSPPSQSDEIKDIKIYFLERAVSHLEEDKRDLREDKKVLLEDKKDLKARVKDLERDLLFAKASLTAVVQLRSLVEVMLYSWSPELHATDSSLKIVGEMQKDPSDPRCDQLTDEWKKVLVGLEGDVKLEAPVCKELKNIYQQLSKEIYFPSGGSETGFFVCGRLPLRAAVGLLLLALQKKTPSNGEIAVKYCDERFMPRFILKHGRYTKFKNT